MIPLIWIAGAVVVGGVLLAAFWKDITAWIKRASEKVSEVIRQVVFGVKIFVKKIGEAIKEISKHYSKNENGKWVETIVSREVEASEVPKEIRELAGEKQGEVDISDKLEKALSH